MRGDLAATLGIIAVVVAVASLFLCAPVASLIALGAIVLSILAIRGGAKGWGIAGIIVASLVFLASVGMMFEASQKLSQAGKELEQIGRGLSEKCFVCKGTGWVDCPFCVNGRSPTTGGICPFCNGQGEHICTFCNGTGKPR